MAQNPASTKAEAGEVGKTPPAPVPGLGSATYEIIRQRLQKQGATLQDRLGQLDVRRQEVFGKVEFKLLQSDRITTKHNCTPRDMVQLGPGRFLFGFNVQFGLKKEIELTDVFSVYDRDATAGTFKEGSVAILEHKDFLSDFKRLYNVYERAFFSKFFLIDGNLYVVFRIGVGVNDISVFKWTFNNGELIYLDGRSETEYRKVGFPPQYEFRWLAPSRESFRYGDYSHISIEDRVFVECVGGDLTIKIEDNTATGEGIFSEAVDDKHQKVDDAEINYGIVGHIILLKIRPYKENAARYFIFNEKLQSVSRVDSIGQSCVLLPEGQGLIFPDGFYLGTGELKRFESKERGMLFERVVHAPNGEDSLFVFHNRETGEYVLMPYRLILQKVEERMSCHGFALFPDGNLLVFRADDEPQRHHMIQLRQTPFHQPGYEPAGKRDSFLYQVGNKEVVRTLAEGTEVLTLVGKENPYSELYVDLVKRCTAMLDAHPWLGSEDGFQIDGALREVREAADKAVEEFDKVRRLQREAVQKVNELHKKCDERFNILRRASFATVNDFVQNLSALRQLRGELISTLEIRYIDATRVRELEQCVAAQSEELSKSCVKYLLLPNALDPYRNQANGFLTSVENVQKAADGKRMENSVLEAGRELEMLIEIVNNLRIEDATETTRIIDGITTVYSTLNQVKAALKKRLQSLVSTEGAAQFDAQMKLLGQSASSYLDLCSSPSKCDEYLNRITVQIEELEGAFADFEEYTVPLSDKRTSIYETFEQRKLALIEQRNKKAGALLTAAERILKVVQNRLAGFKTVEEISAYMASDLMISKVRDIVDQLMALDDSVKADDLLGRLKSVQQEAVRQLKDRQELFVDGQSIIQLGKHKFNVNVQPLDLTVVFRDGLPNVHLTSTRFFEPITDEEFIATKAVWDQELVSETPTVYRSEYLAFRLLQALEKGEPKTVSQFLALPFADRLSLLQEFISTRFQEGYTKGIHDLDGEKIISALAAVHEGLQLGRYLPLARACAIIFWHRFCPVETKALWDARLKGFASRNKMFPGNPTQAVYINGLRELITTFLEQNPLFPSTIVADAGEYLFFEKIAGDTFVISQEAQVFAGMMRQELATKGSDQIFQQSIDQLQDHPRAQFELTQDWVKGFTLEHPEARAFIEEISAYWFCSNELQTRAVQGASRSSLGDLKGAHPLIKNNNYVFDYFEFKRRLEHFIAEVVPVFEKFQHAKHQALGQARTRLRLDDFKPKVLTSFVRNQLIDSVYLPLVGDNLAKQIGAAGNQKRTDLMGLLLLISPPGYGKTTLVEYVANRLGLVFIKINGPALGHSVNSLDPEEAPNAAAREEINKLNLALEMGDNVLICVDDIQHCSPEFLQKFISLCDAQRKIEGVWRGKSRTYDLRGRKVVVVMAGNPYTESGQKFKLPDMLSNRADTYNLGDIIGGNPEWFKASYLENALTSNTVLAPLASKSQKDVRAFIHLATGGTRDEQVFEGSYSPQEVEEILSIMKKLVRIRDVVLKVNMEYIHSAGQADDYRTEPPFRLQGSYRNMNRMAEKVVSIMNDSEVQALIHNHYRNEAQTLTTGAEANFLKLKELLNVLTPEEKTRWDEIKKTFQRNQLTRGADQNDPTSRVVAQLSALQLSLEGIQGALVNRLTQNGHSDPALPTAVSPQIVEGLAELRKELTHVITESQNGDMVEKVQSLSHEMEMLHSTLATLKDLAAQQRDHLKNTQQLMEARARQGTVEIELTQDMLTNDRAFLDRFHEVLSTAQTIPMAKSPPVEPNPPPPPA